MASREIVIEAATRYAAKLQTEDAKGPCTYAVTLCRAPRLRGWARIERACDRGVCTVVFVGLASAGVYAAKGETQYGDRIGNVFALADVDTAKRSA